MTVGKDTKLIIGLLCFAAVLVVKLFSIQVLDDKYKESADNQAMVYQTIYPSRGIIYDRKGKILVSNRVVYDIMITPREMAKVEFDTLALAKALDVEVDFIREKFDYYKKYRSRIGWQSQMFLRQVSPEAYARFAEIQYKFPGFRGVPRTTRDYQINAGGNLLGYCSEVDDAYMARHPGEYRKGDYAGRTGIEESSSPNC